METWVALLRGVNVGGVTIRNAELAAVFDGLGYADVRTVLASGNAVFRATGTAVSIRTDVEAALRERYGRDVPVVLVPHERLAAVLDAWPFDAAADRHDYVVFASDEAALDAVVHGIVPGDDEALARGDGVLYWSCPKGSSTTTAVAKHLAGAAARRAMTTRNANTLRKLL